MFRTISRSLAALAIGASLACAHATYYEPQTSADTSRIWRGGIVYPIPPVTNPEFRVKVLSLGVVPAPAKDGQHQASMVLIRLFFFRPQALPEISADQARKPEFLDPLEQTLLFPNGASQKPSLIHALSEMRPLIELNSDTRQVVELFFDLPKQYLNQEPPSFVFQWKVHYGENQSEEQRTTRFQKSASRSYPHDPIADDPFDYFSLDPVVPPEWTGKGWFWWYPGDSERTLWP